MKGEDVSERTPRDANHEVGRAGISSVSVLSTTRLPKPAV